MEAVSAHSGDTNPALRMKRFPRGWGFWAVIFPRIRLYSSENVSLFAIMYLYSHFFAVLSLITGGRLHKSWD